MGSLVWFVSLDFSFCNDLMNLFRVNVVLWSDFEFNSIYPPSLMREFVRQSSLLKIDRIL
jgi:hypothetical protein